MFIFGTETADLEGGEQIGAEAEAVLLSSVFFLSYFLYSPHHVAIKWVSEESCSLPWAIQLINSPPRTHRHTHALTHTH